MQKKLSTLANNICQYKIKKVCAFSLPHNFALTWNFIKKFGTYGAVTRKKQKLRENFYEEKYKYNPNIIPKYSKVKRGSRGGWINNPLKEVTKNNGSNFMYEQKIKKELSPKESECINNLIKIRKEFYNKEDIYNNRITNNEILEINNNSIYKNNENKISNCNFFSLCENFIDQKKEIIHKIENPQKFVDNHVKSLVSEYNNINVLHEKYNVNSYPKVPTYIKDFNNSKKKKNIASKNVPNSGNSENVSNCANYENISNIPSKKKRENTDEPHLRNEEHKQNHIPDSSTNTFKYDSSKMSSDHLHHGLEKCNIPNGEDGNIYDSINVTKKERKINESNNFDNATYSSTISDKEKIENDLKNLYIENFLNYTDENDIDISCLDTFTTLSTIDRNKKLGTLFSTMNASFILYNQCVIPSKFSEGTINEYLNTRNGCSLFDKSYQLIIKLSGGDCLYICNQFISSDLNDLNNYEACHTCILDNKAFVIDSCYVLKCENEITLITSGYYKKGLYEFLSDYILFCKDSGMDVDIEVDMNKRVLSLQGPLSNMVFNDVLERFEWENKDKDIRYLKNVIKKKDENCLYFRNGENKIFFNIPYMSFQKMNMINKISNEIEKMDIYEITCIRTGNTGEDGYEFIVDNNISDIFVKLFLNHAIVKLAGAYALDILRMESGFPQYGVDIFKNTSPITASLSWTLKYKKIKERSIFGFQNLLKEYSMKPKILRIGILCNELVFKTCKILSYPYKKPIGYVTSCTWSPVYKKRIAQGYIKREFAKNNEKILISIPIDIPQEFSKKKKYKILRSRSAHKFALAQVCSFPFVEHRY